MNISASHKDKMLPHFFWPLALIFGFMAVWHVSGAQCRETDEKNAGIPTAQPIHIESDTMEARRETSMLAFSGNVIAVQEGMEIRADSIKIFFDGAATQSEPIDKFPDPGPPGVEESRIKKIVAQGRVRCLTGRRQVFADKAVYTANDQTLELTGKKVKLAEGGNEVTGEKLTLFIPQNRVVMESKTKGRVRASFSPAKTPLPVKSSGSSP